MKSTLKTTAAVLRWITGERDADWAGILGKSVHTIRHVEAGTLELSGGLAAKMNYESGISIKWLMDGDPTATPLSATGEEYTKEIYDKVQARKKNFATATDFNVKFNVLECCRIICSILVSANCKRNYHLAVYRTMKAIDELRAEFGEVKDLHSKEKVLAYVLDVQEQDVPEPLREEWRRIQQVLVPEPKSKQLSRRTNKTRFLREVAAAIAMGIEYSEAWKIVSSNPPGKDYYEKWQASERRQRTRNLRENLTGQGSNNESIATKDSSKKCGPAEKSGRGGSGKKSHTEALSHARKKIKNRRRNFDNEPFTGTRKQRPSSRRRPKA